uniref:Uncharacterized protein n=1 Tax=Lepeophtheirus salmonis TaxID=72036 RepID=A0A0K2TLJ5_LEPSM
MLTNPSCSPYLYSCMTMNLCETISNAFSKSTKIVAYLDDAHKSKPSCIECAMFTSRRDAINPFWSVDIMYGIILGSL